MRICFVTPEFVTEESCFDGGLSNYLLRVSLGLIELKHKPVIIVSSDKNEIVTYQKIEVHRVYVKPISYSVSLYWLYQSYVLNDYLGKLILNEKIDIVQYSSYTGAGIFRIKNLPAVTRISSFNPLLSHYYNFAENNDNQNRNKIEIAAIQKTDSAFCPSKLIAGEILRSEQIEVEVIESPYVAESIESDYTLLSNLSGKKYLLFFGTLGLLKGVKTIAEILTDLFSKHYDLYFAFIGKDAGYLGKNMMDYIYKCAPSYRDRIYYFEKMNHARLYPFIKSAYAVVLPSRIDNFPNACIESMAMGKIVIGTINTGFDQLINDGVSGFLCEKDNPEDLLQVVDKVISLSDNDKTKVESKALERIELLKPECVVKQLVDYYSGVIKKNQSSTTVEFSSTENTQLMLWDVILSTEDIFTENRTKLHQQSETIRLLINSKSYRIGKFFMKPLLSLKRRLKWQ